MPFSLKNLSDLCEEERESFTEEKWLRNVSVAIVQKRPLPACTVMGIIILSLHPRGQSCPLSLVCPLRKSPWLRNVFLLLSCSLVHSNLSSPKLLLPSTTELSGRTFCDNGSVPCFCSYTTINHLWLLRLIMWLVQLKKWIFDFISFELVYILWLVSTGWDGKAPTHCKIDFCFQDHQVDEA